MLEKAESEVSSSRKSQHNPVPQGFFLEHWMLLRTSQEYCDGFPARRLATRGTKAGRSALRRFPVQLAIARRLRKSSQGPLRSSEWRSRSDRASGTAEAPVTSRAVDNLRVLLDANCSSLSKRSLSKLRSLITNFCDACCLEPRFHVTVYAQY